MWELPSCSLIIHIMSKHEGVNIIAHLLHLCCFLCHYQRIISPYASMHSTTNVVRLLNSIVGLRHIFTLRILEEVNNEHKAKKKLQSTRWIKKWVALSLSEFWSQLRIIEEQDAPIPCRTRLLGMHWRGPQKVARNNGCQLFRMYFLITCIQRHMLGYVISKEWKDGKIYLSLPPTQPSSPTRVEQH